MFIVYSVYETEGGAATTYTTAPADTTMTNVNGNNDSDDSSNIHSIPDVYKKPKKSGICDVNDTPRGRKNFRFPDPA